MLLCLSLSLSRLPHMHFISVDTLILAVSGDEQVQEQIGSKALKAEIEVLELKCSMQVSSF